MLAGLGALAVAAGRAPDACADCGKDYFAGLRLVRSEITVVRPASDLDEDALWEAWGEDGRVRVTYAERDEDEGVSVIPLKERVLVATQITLNVTNARLRHARKEGGREP